MSWSTARSPRQPVRGKVRRVLSPPAAVFPFRPAPVRALAVLVTPPATAVLPLLLRAAGCIPGSSQPNPLHRYRVGWRLSSLTISLAFVAGGLIGGGSTLL